MTQMTQMVDGQVRSRAAVGEPGGAAKPRAEAVRARMHEPWRSDGLMHPRSHGLRLPGRFAAGAGRDLRHLRHLRLVIRTA